MEATLNIPEDHERPSAAPWSAWLRPVVVGVCLGSLALWLAFRGLDFGQLLAGLRYVNYPLTAAALLTTLATLVLGALRWQLLFYPDHRQRSFAALFRANVIGQMLNIAIPVRVGEIARIYAVAGDGALSKARVLGTLAVEKALDLAAFALAVVAVLALVALPPDIRLQQRILWIGGVGGVLILWTLARRPALCSHAVGWMVAHLPAAWQRRAERTAGNFIAGLSVLQNSWAWLGAIVLTLALVALAASTNYLLFLAFGLRLPPVAALFLLVVLQVGAVPPSLPGKVGIFHYLIVVALAPFGVDRATALSYAIVLYGVALLPKILLGAGYLAVGGRGNGKAKALPYRQ